VQAKEILVLSLIELLSKTADRGRKIVSAARGSAKYGELVPGGMRWFCRQTTVSVILRAVRRPSVVADYRVGQRGRGYHAFCDGGFRPYPGTGCELAKPGRIAAYRQH